MLRLWFLSFLSSNILLSLSWVACALKLTRNVWLSSSVDWVNYNNYLTSTHSITPSINQLIWSFFERKCFALLEELLGFVCCIYWSLFIINTLSSRQCTALGVATSAKLTSVKFVAYWLHCRTVSKRGKIIKLIKYCFKFYSCTAKSEKKTFRNRSVMTLPTKVSLLLKFAGFLFYFLLPSKCYKTHCLADQWK